MVWWFFTFSIYVYNLFMIISKKHKFIFYKPLKCAGTSVEWALTIKFPLGQNDISTGHAGYHQDYGDWSKNLDKYRYIADGRGEHYTPGKLKLVWPLLSDIPIEDFKIITIARDPIGQLVSYYWWAHTNPTMGAFCPDACPVNGDTRKDIYRKFVLWLNKPYRAAIFKDWTSAPIETPVETLIRINEAMVAEADTVLLHSDLQNECKEKLGIKFPLPKMKSGKKVIADKASDYFFNNKKLLNDILTSFPISVKYLKNDS